MYNPASNTPTIHLFAIYLPLISIGTSSESHRNLIGTSPKDYYTFTLI